MVTEALTGTNRVPILLTVRDMPLMLEYGSGGITSITSTKVRLSVRTKGTRRQRRDGRPSRPWWAECCGAGARAVR